MREFISQLRKRHVIKVGIAYLVAAWLILQLADVIFPAMGLPAWSITLVLGLLAVGFPLALVLSWVFDFTAEGVQRTADAPAVSPPGSTVTEQSIAVLPFPDMSAEHDQEHFCDGLTEELLNVFTRVPNLRVASRTSCFAFKGTKSDMASIAEKLRVRHLLEGSVRKAGSRIRVTAQLVEVATDSHVWSETYDR
jgi:adenylate cyclase